jgi:hypothetical protein
VRDVYVRDLVAGTTTLASVGATGAIGDRDSFLGKSDPQMTPDGRYVTWAESNGTDLDVRVYDTQTGRYATAGAGSAEQSFPIVDAGVVYWTHNVRGQRLHIDTYDVATGRSGRYNDYGTSDVAAFYVSGGNATWLSKDGTTWKLRAGFDGGSVALSALRRIVPAAAPARLARLSADSTPRVC